MQVAAEAMEPTFSHHSYGFFDRVAFGTSNTGLSAAVYSQGYGWVD